MFSRLKVLKIVLKFPLTTRRYLQLCKKDIQQRCALNIANKLENSRRKITGLMQGGRGTGNESKSNIYKSKVRFTFLAIEHSHRIMIEYFIAL